MFALAIHQTAGVGVGIFLGCLLGFWLHRRSGRPQGYLMRDSIPFTALVAGMLGWVAAAVMTVVVG